MSKLNKFTVRFSLPSGVRKDAEARKGRALLCHFVWAVHAAVLERYPGTDVAFAGGVDQRHYIHKSKPEFFFEISTSGADREFFDLLNEVVARYEPKLMRAFGSILRLEVGTTAPGTPSRKGPLPR